MILFYTYLLLINALGFLIMRLDKQKARKKLWRIPEHTIVTLAVIGGSLGVLLGMQVFHHKTLRPKFTVGLPMILAVQIVIGILCLLTMQK